MFRVSREIEFCYGHRLINYDGKCRHLHGHNGLAVITLEAPSLDARGMLVDFGEIKRGPSVKAANAPLPTLDAPKSEVTKDRVATTRLYRYWAIPGLNDKHSVPLDVAAIVLGGLSSSRLDNALVRDEKIAVAVVAQTQVFQHVSVFEVYADVKPGVEPAKVAKRLDEIMADFLRDGPTADEVDRAKVRTMASRVLCTIKPATKGTRPSVAS